MYDCQHDEMIWSGVLIPWNESEAHLAVSLSFTSFFVILDAGVWLKPKIINPILFSNPKHPSPVMGIVFSSKVLLSSMARESLI